MQGILYEETSVWFFMLATLVIGGGAAWITGRAVAAAWSPFWRGLVFFLLLTAAVRFIHFVLFQGTLLSLHYYLVDAFFVTLIGLLGFRHKRVQQMTTQYPWLYVRAGLLRWRNKT